MNTGQSGRPVIGLREILTWLVLFMLYLVAYNQQRMQPILALALLFLASAATWIGIRGKGITAVKALTIIVFALAIFHINAQFAAAELMATIGVSPQPLHPVPEIQANVYLGGDRVMLSAPQTNPVIMTVCFYIRPDRAVLAAHYVKNFSEQQTARAMFTHMRDPGYTVDVLANNAWGLAIAGVPEDVSQREAFPIARVEEIEVGSEATLHSMVGGTFNVMVEGFRQWRGQQVLLIAPLDPSYSIEKGMSGSPIVQNGKIIGFASSRIAIPFQGITRGHAAIAADVYYHLLEHLGGP